MSIDILKEKVNIVIIEWNEFKKKANEYRMKDLLDRYNIAILDDESIKDSKNKKL